MKKLFILLLSLVFLASCSLFTKIDDVMVHNELVKLLDNLKNTEQSFYQSYINLFPDDEISELEKNQLEFKKAVQELDEFFGSQKFASYQIIFLERYNEYYKDFILNYMRTSDAFLALLKTEGASFDVISKYSFDLDSLSINFVDIHNRFIELVNQQSDE